MTTKTARRDTAAAVQRRLNQQLKDVPGFDIAICYVDTDLSGYRVKVTQRLTAPGVTLDAVERHYTDWFGSHMNADTMTPIVVRAFKAFAAK